MPSNTEHAAYGQLAGAKRFFVTLAKAPLIVSCGGCSSGIRHSRFNESRHDRRGGGWGRLPDGNPIDRRGGRGVSPARHYPGGLVNGLVFFRGKVVAVKGHH